MMLVCGFKNSIAESIRDGPTVRLNCALAPSSLLVDRDLLEKKSLNLAEAEGVSDVEESNVIVDRAVELKEMMKASRRIENIAEYSPAHGDRELLREFLVNVVSALIDEVAWPPALAVPAASCSVMLFT
jgi:hypothetical protein